MTTYRGGLDPDRQKPSKLRQKQLSAPIPFTAALRFVNFAPGKKVIMADNKGVRYWLKQEVFAEILRNEYPCISDWTNAGICFEHDWITEKKGTSYLTRPV